MQFGASVPAAPQAIALSEMNDHKIAKLLSHAAPHNRPRRGRFAIEEMGMAVDSLQKQPARVRGQPLQEGPVGQSGGRPSRGAQQGDARRRSDLRQRGRGGTKPDLALIKQVEHAPTSVLEGPVRLCRDSGLGSQGR